MERLYLESMYWKTYQPSFRIHPLCDHIQAEQRNERTLWKVISDAANVVDMKFVILLLMQIAMWQDNTALGLAPEEAAC